LQTLRLAEGVFEPHSAPVLPPVEALWARTNVSILCVICLLAAAPTEHRVRSYKLANRRTRAGAYNIAFEKPRGMR